jgi:hypothetical protein
MSTSLRVFFLSAILSTAVNAFAQINIVNFDFGAVLVGCSDWGFTYQGAQLTCIYPVTQDYNQTPGFGWTVGWVVARGGFGVTDPGSAFCPPSFDGLPFHQAALLQNAGSFAWQAIGGFTPGRYTLSFYLGGRCGYSPQRVAAMIDGYVVGTWDVPVGMPFTLETTTFTVNSGGTHAVEFMGLNPPDSTAFLSYVVITPAERQIH